MINRDPVVFKVKVEFDYIVVPLDDDPENEWELAEIETVEIKRHLLGLAGYIDDSEYILLKPILGGSDEDFSPEG